MDCNQCRLKAQARKARAKGPAQPGGPAAAQMQ